MRESAPGRTWEHATRYISLAPQRCGTVKAAVAAFTLALVGAPLLAIASPPAPLTPAPTRPAPTIAAAAAAGPVVDVNLLAEVSELRRLAALRPARQTATPKPTPTPSVSVKASSPRVQQKKRITQPPRRRLLVAPADGSRAAKVVAFALSQVGKPYVYAKAGPDSYDCSGLAKASYAAVGMNIPHQTGGIVRLGQRVERNQLAPGDLVFPSSGHVGIYVGGGQMVHAPHAGDHVRVAAVYAFWTARRLLL